MRDESPIDGEMMEPLVEDDLHDATPGQQNNALANERGDMKTAGQGETKTDVA